ncbi:MAG: hypothetical protein R3F46_11750 [bacterium]
MSNASGVIARRDLKPEELAAKERLEEKGNEALDNDDYKLALECFHKITILDGADPNGWNMLGVCFSNLEFAKEAWRSYMLALAADPENLDALWYASEFLSSMEDFELARLMLSRYIELESDEERLEEAREELDEVNRQLGDRRSGTKTINTTDDELDEMEMPHGEDGDEEEELPEGFAVDEDDEADYSMDFSVAEDDFEDEAEESFDDDDNTGMSDEEEETFVASVTLQLTGVALSCRNCGTALPADAPYCFSCKSICFYED